MALGHRAYCRVCRSESASYTLFGQYRIPGGQSYALAFACNACGYPRAVVVVSKHSPNDMNGLLDAQHENVLRVLEDLPERPQRATPEYTPDAVARFYLQATHNLELGNPDAAGAMARKSLDVATKQLGAPRDKWLKARIDWMHENGMLTDDLHAWAIIIKNEGDDATHDEDPYTDEEAQELVDFTEIFLTFVYTIPGKIKAKAKAVVTPGAGEVHLQGEAPDTDSY